MKLWVLHPLWSSRSCDDCEKWIYNEDGTQMYRGGSLRLPVLRPKGAKTPCHKCPKIPENTPEQEKTRRAAVELSPKNWRAFKHYRECAAVGHFPNDPIVRRNAAIIKDMLDAIKDLKTEQWLGMIGAASQSNKRR